MLKDDMFSSLTWEVIGQLNDFRKISCALRVFSAFTMGAKRKDGMLAGFVGLP
jgi:hypothetical protein